VIDAHSLAASSVCQEKHTRGLSWRTASGRSRVDQSRLRSSELRPPINDPRFMQFIPGVPDKLLCIVDVLISSQ
jgi:hypothetical protein